MSFTSTVLGKHYAELDTPTLLVDRRVMHRNLERAQREADTAGLRLRPHIKTHKMAEIAHKQLSMGASGVTCAKVSEAEWLVASGVDNVFIAYPIVSEVNAERVQRLRESARVSCVVDSFMGVEVLAKSSIRPEPLGVYLKIDTGMGRVGVPPEQAQELAEYASTQNGIELIGLCAHEGRVYGFPDVREREAVARREYETLKRIANEVEQITGIEYLDISVGATPSFATALQEGGLSEARPGNYVFNDAIQVGLGVATQEECALSVLTTVVGGVYNDRFVIDAGSKTLGLDQGAHGVVVTEGYGIVMDAPGIRVSALSEEHGRGVIVDMAYSVALGDKFRIIPNHSCATVSNFEYACVIENERVVEVYSIGPRGALA